MENNNVDRQYNDLFREVINEGEWSDNRTARRTKEIFDGKVKMDMREGFPIFTSRKMPFKVFAGELECFIKGFTNKNEFRKRGVHWWDSWCNPQKVPYSNDDDTKEKMRQEQDLGHIYGYQWRNFSQPNSKDVGVDQLKSVVDRIKNGIDDRRLIVMYWNPLAIDHQGLPPCHYRFYVNLSPCGKYLDLKWNQRSVDLALGANNTLYGILIHLLANECGRVARYLVADYDNVHIYENQIDIVKEQLKRPTHKLPTLRLNTDKFTDIYDWTYDCVELVDYEHSGVLKYPQAEI